MAARSSAYTIVLGTVIKVGEGGHVKKGEAFAEWDPHNVPIITEKSGKVEFRDMISGVTVRSEVDPETGVKGTVVIEHKEDLHPQIVIVGEDKQVLASYSIPAGAHVAVAEGKKVPGGTLLAKTPRKIAKTKDITGGLPRVAELFEARKPKDSAEIAKIDGIVEIGGTVRGKRKVIVTDPETGNSEEHLVPLSKHIIVSKDDLVVKGQQLTEGAVPPHDILDVLGPQQLQEHLVTEVQEVYRLQGVEIADKHIEIIIRQMLRKVKVTDPGDSALLWGDQIDKLLFEDENNRVVEKGGKACRSSAGPPWHHQGEPRDRVVHQRRQLPGHHPCPDRSCHAGPRRQPPRLQGERHHGSPHPSGHRFPRSPRRQGDQPRRRVQRRRRHVRARAGVSS
jgi:DNA-directed RNA polymerase subunit beta'